MNVKFFLGILIASILSGCATISQENNLSKKLNGSATSTNRLTVSKEEMDFLINYKSNKSKKAINPKALFKNNDIKISQGSKSTKDSKTDTRNVGSDRSNANSKAVPNSERFIHISVTYPGKYKITNDDKVLMSTYHRRFIYKEYGNREKRVYRLPAYNPLEMSRSGPNWKVEVTEKFSGKFKIVGRNSEGKNLNTVCNTIKECFNMI